MGSIIFEPRGLADHLSETAGYKAGLTLSIDQLCDVMVGTEYPDKVRASETSAVRVRSEDYEDIFFTLLQGIGFTEERYRGPMYEMAQQFHKYKRDAVALEIYEGVMALHRQLWRGLIEKTISEKKKAIDPSPFLMTVHQKYGRVGLDIAIEHIEILNRGTRLSPHSTPRYVEWEYALALDGLFLGNTASPEHGTFIDQRYVNYLYRNPEKLSDMDWRKFEQLTSEFFQREGYEVEIGPGSNDDGVDIRIWDIREDTLNPPLCLVQCKRTKSKVEKVVVKGLYADVEFEGAQRGLIVTTSDLSPGAKSTIQTRGYPIDGVDNSILRTWLAKLRVPGTGIVRV